MSSGFSSLVFGELLGLLLEALFGKVIVHLLTFDSSSKEEEVTIC